MLLRQNLCEESTCVLQFLCTIVVTERGYSEAEIPGGREAMGASPKESRRKELKIGRGGVAVAEASP